MLAERKEEDDRSPFSSGVRIEHNQEVVNAVQFGPRYEHFGDCSATPTTRSTCARHDLFTFCMCGGVHHSERVAGRLLLHQRDEPVARDSPFANSGLVVTVPVEEFGGTDVLAGVRLQERYESLAYDIGGRSEYRSRLQGGRLRAFGKHFRPAAVQLSARVAVRPARSSAPRGRRGRCTPATPDGLAMERALPSQCGAGGARVAR